MTFWDMIPKLAHGGYAKRADKTWRTTRISYIYDDKGGHVIFENNTSGGSGPYYPSLAEIVAEDWIVE